jgi:hypothetical protein
VVIGFILFTYFPFLWQGDKNRKKFVKKKIVPVLSIAEQRAQTLQKANMDLLTNPEQALEQLKKLAIENPQDTIGKEAIQIFTDKLRRTEREPAIGDLLVQVKQPVEALKYLPITTSADVREKAVFMAFEMGKEEKEKRLYLSEDIRLWLIKLNNEGKALERIKLYEKTFPKEPNPFAYYLKTDEQKLVDIFRRISSFFSSTLKMYIDMEFPGIQFKSLPIVEVRKDKTNLYRISANYEGDIFLRKDSLSKIKFTFWFIDDHWQVVETNLTPERKSYAAEQFTKWSGKKLPLKAMLSFLEKTFQAQYPDLLLYEEVPSRDLSRKNEKE